MLVPRPSLIVGMIFTTDTILKELYAKLQNSPEDGAVAVEENIRLLQHHEVSSFISLYREEGKLWAQIRIGYIYKPLPPARPRMDFRDFMNREKHNPLKLPSGQKIDLAGCFVTPYKDEKHRWGFDVIMDDCGFEDCAELFDYLLTAKY